MDNRQLDVLLAEHLFGQKVELVPLFSDELTPMVEAADGVLMILTNEQTGERRYIKVDAVPAYSTTWEGLGLVVEAMQARNWIFGLDEFAQIQPGHRWRARFDRHTSVPVRSYDERGQAYGETAPMAAALAALRALGVEVSE